MLGRTYENQVCSASRALEVVGERWTLLILRDAMFAHHTRFMQWQRSLGLASNILSSRLDWLVTNQLMEIRPLADDPGVNEYLLTPKGMDFQPVIIALTSWGDRWAAPDGPPILNEHEGCGGAAHQLIRCERCGEELAPGTVRAQPGPGMLQTA